MAKHTASSTTEFKSPIERDVNDNRALEVNALSDEGMVMKACKLTVRCYAEPKHDQWQAFCLDFDLAVQGDNFPEVKAKLEAQIVEYVNDALIGEDREYAHELLKRRAPWHMYAKYHVGCTLQNWGLLQHLDMVRHHVGKYFRETLPLRADCPVHA
jgi:hypothetical protein